VFLSVLGVHSVLIAHFCSSVHKLCTRCTSVLIKSSFFKTTTFCTLCAHSCTLCTGVHKNIFDEHTYFFLHQLPLHFAGDSRTGGGRSPTWAPSCFISCNRTGILSFTLYLSRTFWAAWRWPPTASTEPSPMNGTICRVLITPEECVIPQTGRAVGASSSTSILGL